MEMQLAIEHSARRRVASGQLCNSLVNDGVEFSGHTHSARRCTFENLAAISRHSKRETLPKVGRPLDCAPAISARFTFESRATAPISQGYEARLVKVRPSRL